jgi:Tfp pilus assembly protein PilO
MANTSAKTYSFLAAVLVVACLITGYLVMTKYWQEYNLSKTRKVNVEAENTRLTKALQSSVTFLSTFESQKRNIDLVQLALPSDEADVANFINSFSQLATQSGVVLLNLQVSEKVQRLHHLKTASKV